MSKKAKRRAVRQAFPKAKSAPASASRGSRAGGARGRGRAPVAGRGRVQSGQGRGRGGGQALRPPSIRRAVITGALLAFAYFAVIQWLWKSGGNTQSNAMFSFLVFFLYAGVVYAVEWWKYKRKLGSMKGPSK